LVPFAVTNSYHSKTWYTASPIIALYENGQSHCVPCLHYSPGQVTLSRTQTSAKWAVTPITTQTVLCEAPYCLALLHYIHVQHERSLPFTHNPASVQ